MIAISYNPSFAQYFQGHRFAYALSDVLRDLGYDSSACPGFEFHPKTRCIIAVGVRSLRASLLAVGVPILLYNVDRFRVSNYRPWQIRLRRFGFCMNDIRGIIDYTPMAKAEFKAISKPWTFAPLGYHRSFEFDHIPENPSYDVSMIGTMGTARSRRAMVLETFKGMSVCHQYLDSVPKIDFQSASESECDAYTEFFLGAGKIFLHINRKRSVDNFPDIRVIQLGFSNRRFVLMDRCEWLPKGITPGVHCGVEDSGALHELARFYLSNEEKRVRVADAAYRWVKDHYRLVDTWREPIKEALEWI